MKDFTINRKNLASAEGRVEELTPQSERYAHKIIMNVFGKRFELTCRTEARVITRGPAKVIEMPIRAPIEP